MESPPFDLGNAISEHISLIKDQGSLTLSDCRELKDHLFDSVESLQRQGLSAEESFIVARKRIGHAELLGEEYSKVNLSLTHNKLWSYLLIGFNLFYGVTSLLLTLISIIYFIIYKEFGTSSLANTIVISLHALLIFMLYRILKAKHQIALFIEKQVKRGPLRLIFLSALPLLVNSLMTSQLGKLMPDRSVLAPVRMFDNSLTELSFNLTGICLIGFMVCLVFSLRNTDKLTLKNLFRSPSITFLLLLGLLVEFIAASSRLIHFKHIIFQSLSFGLVYFAFSFFIARYNRKEEATKYVLIASSIGFTLEVGVGISADISRGNTYYTVYFGLALLLTAAFGRYFGGLFRQHELKQA